MIQPIAWARAGPKVLFTARCRDRCRSSRRRRRDDDHRALRVVDAVETRRAKEESGESAAAPRADELREALSPHLGDVAGRPDVTPGPIGGFRVVQSREVTGDLPHGVIDVVAAE